MEGNLEGVSLFLPRSHCGHCKKVINLIDLIPVFGYLIQLGKCRHCCKAISYYYPLNELIHLLAGLILFNYFNISILFFVNYSLFFILYNLFVLDLKYFYLPVYFNISICFIGFTTNGVLGLYISPIYIPFELSSIAISLIGFFVGYMSLWLINFIFKLLKKKEGIGGGDFILFGGIGSLIGPLALAPIILIGCLSLFLLLLIKPKQYCNEIPLGSGIIFGFFIYSLSNFFELSFLLSVI